MSNEIKIGILAVVTIIIGVIGVKFMKGQNVFSNDTTIYVKYNEVNQLTPSSPVLMNGFPIGSVAEVRLDPKDMNSVLVTLHINKEIRQSIRDLATTLENLKVSTEQLESIMRNNAQNLNTTMTNMAKLTNTLADNNDKITGILSNTQTFTDDLSQMNLSSTMSKADTTLESANQAVRQLQTTLATSDKMVSNLNEMVGKMKNGEGTLGLMLNDDQLYKNINETSQALSKVLVDFQEKPYRYMPLKSRRKVLKSDEKDAEKESQKNNN